MTKRTCKRLSTTTRKDIPMSNPINRLWQVFVQECREYLADVFMPLVVVARWIRRRTRR